MATIGKFMALESFVSVHMGDATEIPDWKVIAREAVKLGPKVACYSYGKTAPSLETWYRALKRREDLPLCWQLMARYVATLSSDMFPQTRWEKMICDAAAVDCAALITALFAKHPAMVSPAAGWFRDALRLAAQVDYSQFPETRARITTKEETAFHLLFHMNPVLTDTIMPNNVLALRTLLASNIHMFTTAVIRRMYYRSIDEGHVSMLEELMTNTTTKVPLPIQPYPRFNFLHAKRAAIGLAWHIEKQANAECLKNVHGYVLPEDADAWKNLAPAIACAFKRLGNVKLHDFLALCTPTTVYCRWPLVTEALLHWSPAEFSAVLEAHPMWGNHLYAGALFSKNKEHLQTIRTAIISTGSVVDSCLFTGTLDDFREMVVEFYGNEMPPFSVLKAALQAHAHCCFPAYLFDRLTDADVLVAYNQPEINYSLAALRYLTSRRLQLYEPSATYMWQQLIRWQERFTDDVYDNSHVDIPFSINALADAYHDAGLKMTCSSLHAYFNCIIKNLQYYRTIPAEEMLPRACTFAIADAVSLKQQEIEQIFSRVASQCIATRHVGKGAFECMFQTLGWRLTNPWSLLDETMQIGREGSVISILRIVQRYHPWPKKRNFAFIEHDLDD